MFNKFFNSFIYFLFIYSCAPLQAQEMYKDRKYELIIKEYFDPPKYDTRWHFGGCYTCKGSFVSILCCLLGVEHSRLKIIGKVPEKYLNVSIFEPAKEDLGQILANGSKLKDIDLLDNLSFPKIAVALLEKDYKFTVSSIMDSTEVWCLKIKDTAKLVRYNEIRDTDNRGAGIDTRTKTWEATGMKLHYLCTAIEREANIITYDETNETDIFTFTFPPVPLITMRNFDHLNLFLETHYGLHFVKRKQLESLKLIEFR
jgi:hypothetical protein